MPFLFQIYVEKNDKGVVCFWATNFFTQQKLLNKNSAKKNSTLTLIEIVNSESEFVKSGPLDIWKINLLISDLPPGGPTRSRPNEVNRGDGDSPKLPRVI